MKGERRYWGYDKRSKSLVICGTYIP